jgi:hypothetical protein
MNGNKNIINHGEMTLMLNKKRKKEMYYKMNVDVNRRKVGNIDIINNL